MNFIVNPVISKKDENYKIGLWVRDSVGGVGTLTFITRKVKIWSIRTSYNGRRY